MFFFEVNCFFLLVFAFRNTRSLDQFVPVGSLAYSSASYGLPANWVLSLSLSKETSYCQPLPPKSRTMTDLLNNNYLPFSVRGGSGVTSIESGADQKVSNASRIVQFYNDRCIFITGATGFMGKVDKTVFFFSKQKF